MIRDGFSFCGYFRSLFRVVSLNFLLVVSQYFALNLAYCWLEEKMRVAFVVLCKINTNLTSQFYFYFNHENFASESCFVGGVCTP